MSPSRATYNRSNELHEVYQHRTIEIQHQYNLQSAMLDVSYIAEENTEKRFKVA